MSTVLHVLAVLRTPIDQTSFRRRRAALDPSLPWARATRRIDTHFQSTGSSICSSIGGGIATVNPRRRSNWLPLTLAA